MTSLQVDYWKLQESVRTNKENEKINWKNAQAHMISAKAAAAAVAESHRHNVVMETFSWAQLTEQTRHSLVTESISQFEADTRRISVGNEFTVAMRNADIRQQEANTAQFNADTKRYEWQTSADRLSLDSWRQHREIEQEQQRIDLQKSEQWRKWLDTGVGWVKPSNSNSNSNNSKKKKDVVAQIFGLFFDEGGS